MLLHVLYDSNIHYLSSYTQYVRGNTPYYIYFAAEVEKYNCIYCYIIKIETSTIAQKSEHWMTSSLGSDYFSLSVSTEYLQRSTRALQYRKVCVAS